jgi:hypothetical protein
MKRVIVLLLCSGLPAAAFGQIYASAKLGYASADFNLGSPYNGEVDDRTMSFGAEVGFKLGRRFALELGATKYNSMSGRATPCSPGAVCPLIIQPTGGNDVFAYNISVIPHIEVSDVELFAELGYYRAKVDTRIGLPDEEFTEDGVIAGIGARWYFREPWSVSLKTTRLDDNIYQLTFGVGWGLRMGSDPDGNPERAPTALR